MSGVNRPAPAGTTCNRTPPVVHGRHKRQVQLEGSTVPSFPKRAAETAPKAASKQPLTQPVVHRRYKGQAQLEGAR